jgi:DNA-binding MarR family transcriptional regulator|tara:strand:- start:81 stop:398 length:318 start_codon:yes stop_codon:yes gene_type:complete
MEISKLNSALETFESLNPGNMPVHHALVFLYICEKESCTYRDIEERFSVTNASASRIVSTLSSNAKHRDTSLGLVEKFIDPQEGRRYRVRPVKKGKALYRVFQAL